MTIPKPTENTVTTFLRDELQKEGVHATAFETLLTPEGRREVDLVCRNGGLYACEAKFTERDLLQAVSKIQNDYFKYHKDLGVKGGFAVLYPSELSKHMPDEVLKKLLKTLKFKAVIMFLPEDTRKNFNVYEGTISEIARELGRHILNPPEYVEPSIEWIIKSLREAAEYVTSGLRHLPSSQMEDIFGGEHVFKNILKYKEKEKYPIGELRLASAYLLVNQILFYHVLSRKSEFPKIDTEKLKSPSKLREYFNLVLDVNYKAIFSYDIASRIPREFTDTIRMIINVIEGISPEKIGGDLLGTIFHDLIPLDVRKYVAAFYTNVHAADLLACLSIDRHDVRVSDFAVGSGGLLVAAYRTKRSLLELAREFSEEDHANFISQLLGVDIMPFAASVAACHLALQSPEYHTNKVKVAIWDSTELRPGLKIPSIAGLKYVLTGQTQIDEFQEESASGRGVVRLAEEMPEEIDLTESDVVIMNPPFTRQERIPEDYKEILSSRFEEYKDYTHGQLGYYGYFIPLADKFLAKGGKLAFVLPATFLRTQSARGVRTLLSERYNIEYVITGRKRLNFSESTWKREILLVAEKTNEVKKKDTLFIGIEKLPETNNELQRFCGKIRKIRGNYEDHEISAFSVNHGELERDLDWFRFIAPFQSSNISEIWELIRDSAQNLEKFDEIYDLKNIMKRGVESTKGMKVQAVFIPYSIERTISANDEWILEKIEEDQIIVFNRYLKTRVNIPRKCIIPCLRTTSNNKYMNISGETDFVVVKDFKEAFDFFYGERAKLRSFLPAWERYVNDRLGNFAILRRFPIGAPGTFHLCHYSSKPIAVPGTAWICTINDEEAKILSLWFNSSLNLAQIFHERIEDVWLDIHKYILENFYIINPKFLSKEERNSVLRLFDIFGKKEVLSISEEYQSSLESRKEIDAALLSILGFDNIQIKEILPELYEALRIQFEALQNMGERPTK